MPPKSWRILHLEDNDLDAELIAARLAKSDASIAIDRVVDRDAYLYRLRTGRYSLILSDYQVPTFNGMEALALARQHQPSTPFIFVSGQIGEEFAVETLRQGATDYILKERLARLLSAIERALKERAEREEFRAAEAASQEIQRRLRFAHEAARLGAWEYNLETGEILLTDVCRANLGMPTELTDVSREKLLALVHVDDQEHVVTTIQHSLATHADYDIEFRVIFPDQSIRWLNVRGRLLPDEQGAMTRMTGASFDVTDRRRAAQAVDESEAKFRWLANTISNLAWMADPDGNVTWYNDRWYKYTGVNFDDVCGWRWDSVHDPALLEQVKQRWRESLTTGEPFEMVFSLKGADGIFRPFLTHAQAHRGQDGQIQYWFGTNTDISLQKQAERQLAQVATHERHRAEIFDRLAASSRTLNSVLSQDSILGILAQEARHILGCGMATVSVSSGRHSQSAQRIVSQATNDERSREMISLWGGREAPEAFAFQEPVLKSAGDSHDALTVSEMLEIPLLGHSGRQLGSLRLEQHYRGGFTKEDEAVLQQLAAMASISLENARLYETLREQDRRKDEFLATLSHELRNPLAPIRNGMAILNQSVSGGQAQILEMMNRQLGQMVRLVDDLLDVSRVTSGKFRLQPEVIELQKTVLSSVETSKPIIESGKHQLDLFLPASPIYLHADATRLAQIITNLLNNAAKYTPSGGRIIVTATSDPEHVVIEIKDTGIGIPREMLSRVFDIFTQVGSARERSQGGLGIGLTLVRRLVEMHGGSVIAESDGLGKGSRFIVRLPQYQGVIPATGTDSDMSLISTSEPFASRRILVVDDNVDGAESLAEMLRMSGHEVRTAHSGFEALTMATEFVPEVAFLDIGLPGMNGYDVARRFRSNPALHSVVLIAVTGWGSDEDRRHARESGFDFHFTKPADQRSLNQILMEIPRVKR